MKNKIEKNIFFYYFDFTQRDRKSSKMGRDHCSIYYLLSGTMNEAQASTVARPSDHEDAIICAHVRLLVPLRRNNEKYIRLGKRVHSTNPCIYNFFSLLFFLFLHCRCQYQFQIFT